METIDYLENANICRRLIRAEINLREKECATTLKQDIKRIRKGNVYKREGEPFKLSFFYDMFEYTEIKDRDECDSTRTKLSPRSARRYLNGKDNVDKNFNLFLDLSLEILEIDKWAFFEMVTLYAEKELPINEDIDLEVYKKELRQPVLEQRIEMMFSTDKTRYILSVKYLIDTLNKMSEAGQNKVIDLYNYYAELSVEVKNFWGKLVDELETNPELAERVILLIEKAQIKLNINKMNKDLEILLGMKRFRKFPNIYRNNSDKSRNGVYINVKSLQEHSNIINGRWLHDVCFYYAVGGKRFIDIMIMYSQMTKVKNVWDILDGKAER